MSKDFSWISFNWSFEKEFAEKHTEDEKKQILKDYVAKYFSLLLKENFDNLPIFHDQYKVIEKECHLFLLHFISLPEIKRLKLILDDLGIQHSLKCCSNEQVSIEFCKNCKKYETKPPEGF